MGSQQSTLVPRWRNPVCRNWAGTGSGRWGQVDHRSVAGTVRPGFREGSHGVVDGRVVRHVEHNAPRRVSSRHHLDPEVRCVGMNACDKGNPSFARRSYSTLVQRFEPPLDGRPRPALQTGREVSRVHTSPLAFDRFTIHARARPFRSSEFSLDFCSNSGSVTRCVRGCNALSDSSAATPPTYGSASNQDRPLRK